MIQLIKHTLISLTIYNNILYTTDGVADFATIIDNVFSFNAKFFLRKHF